MATVETEMLSYQKSSCHCVGGLGLIGLAGAAGGAWILSLPAAPVVSEAPPIDKEEAGAIRAGLKPHKRGRPVLATIGTNDATEATDYLMPYGILRRANVADVGYGQRGIQLHRPRFHCQRLLVVSDLGLADLAPALRKAEVRLGRRST
jgi:hypothetical protein